MIFCTCTLWIITKFEQQNFAIKLVDKTIIIPQYAYVHIV